MLFELQQVLPTPLREQKRDYASDIWETKSGFEKGKNYLIVAPSGKGKSTFLHILYGLRKDYEGMVQYRGEDTRKFTIEQWADIRKDKLAIVFQDLRLFESLSALDNIKIKSVLTNHRTEADIRKMAEQLGVAHLLSQVSGTLSYGQRQRIAIIRALCQPFDCLLLDEPFSHLDEENTKAAFQLIGETCREQKAGFILVSLGDDYGKKYDGKLTL